MPPKYYCDYCDKQFHDTLASRKRHTQGTQHQRAKKAWFDSFKDQEDVKAAVCSYFIRTGTCHYGQSCRYAHPAAPGPSNTRTNLLGVGLNLYGQTVGPPSTTPAVIAFGPPSGETIHTSRESKLPPSLQPPPEGGWQIYYPDLPWVDWG